jgi:tRNA pseudouridine13 synthase
MVEYELDFSLPYLTSDLRGVGGRLRATPDHFVVEEIPLYEPAGEGQHLYVRLTKVGLTTKEVQLQLARLFGLDRSEVGFAGMKDKAARTTQTFSLNIGHHRSGIEEEAAARIRTHLPVEVHWAKLHRNKLRPGHLLGNRFRITVSELVCSASEARQRAETIAQRIQIHGLPNFFGPQRFGADGTNARQGLEILQGQRQKQDRWLKRFLLSSVQSYLCNRYLVRRIAVGAFDRLLPGDVAKKHATGGMFDVIDAGAEQPRYLAQDISFTAPIYGPKMWAAKAAAGQLETQVLAESPVTLDALAKAHIEGTRRMGRILLPDLVFEEAPEGLVTLFTLPKGAFATTVMREIMKVDLDPEALFDSDDV